MPRLAVITASTPSGGAGRLPLSISPLSSRSGGGCPAEAHASRPSRGWTTTATAVTKIDDVPVRSTSTWLASSSSRHGSSTKPAKVAIDVRTKVARRAASTPLPETSPTARIVESSSGPGATT